MKLIRYEAHKGYTNEPFRVVRYEYPVVRETTKCYVIDEHGKTRFILKDARRRYAYPTEELAKNSFECRQEKRYWYRKADFDMMVAVKKAIDEGTVYEKQAPEYMLFDDFEGFKV